MPPEFIVNGRGSPFPKAISELFIDYLKLHWTLGDPPLAPDPIGGASYTDVQMADNLIITKAEYSRKYSYHLGVLEQDTPITRDNQRGNQWEFNEPLLFVITVQALKRAEDTSWLQFHNTCQEVLGILGMYKSDPVPIPGIRSVMLATWGRPVIVGNIFSRTIHTQLQYRWQDDSAP